MDENTNPQVEPEVTMDAAGLPHTDDSLSPEEEEKSSEEEVTLETPVVDEEVA